MKFPELAVAKAAALKSSPELYAAYLTANRTYNQVVKNAASSEQAKQAAKSGRALAERKALQHDPEKHEAWLAAAKQVNNARYAYKPWYDKSQEAKNYAKGQWEAMKADPDRLAKRKATRLARYHERMKDPRFVVERRLRARLRGVVRRGEAPSRDKTYGIDWKAIVDYLGPCPGMLSEWHVDHVTPLSKFDLLDPEQVRIAFMPTNHQWLPKSVNLSKGARV